ncbi:CYTH domain-containing protein [Ruminiclostridium cellulolyticum]|uniref:Adenylate cyclase n=1 Tax=Ruminiclostridium cellulolyticum (strain ATCC 35319 / DSM 5812 / JCM 6584 / H10) TaxID=394503 RepID=B8I670_RUMCH|nr:CYTH domain-containing protein [Ruminiclostridium cellulolyticum]ACL76835.1 adenylate cyclase [Ruminiclostridium cellulolyticum H10]
MKKGKNIEVEKKYVIGSENGVLFEQVRMGVSTFLKNYKADPVKVKESKDDYFDTDGGDLYRQNVILRIRTDSKRKSITIKKDIPNKTCNSSDGQLARFEYEKEIISENLDDNWALMELYCKEFTEMFKPKDFHKVIRVEKNREKILFTKNEFSFEVAFDSVTYVNLKNNVSKKEYQIEIELKSDYSHRGRLKTVTDELEKKYSFLKPNFDSKFKRAVDLTQI